MSAEKIAKFLAERDEAFSNDDIEWARRQLPNASSPFVVEMAFHKARYENMATCDEKRRESQRWLAERGLTRLMGGKAVNVSDPLPT